MKQVFDFSLLMIQRSYSVSGQKDLLQRPELNYQAGLQQKDQILNVSKEQGNLAPGLMIYPINSLYTYSEIRF